LLVNRGGSSARGIVVDASSSFALGAPSGNLPPGRCPRCYAQFSAELFVPEGRLTVAQQFTAGDMDDQGVLSPVGTTECIVFGRTFNRPYGTKDICRAIHDPAINRWAILKRPSGSGQRDLCATTRALPWAVVAKAFGLTRRVPRSRLSLMHGPLVPSAPR